MAVSTAIVSPPAEVRARDPRRRSRYRRSEVLWGAAFVTPALALFAVIGVYVIGYGLTLSFAEWNGFTPRWTWVGLRNYADLLWRDPVYAPAVHAAALNTLWVLLAVPVLTVLVSLPLAVLLNSIRRLRALLRSVYFLPYVTSGIAVVLRLAVHAGAGRRDQPAAAIARPRLPPAAAGLARQPGHGAAHADRGQRVDGRAGRRCCCTWPASRRSIPR